MGDRKEDYTNQIVTYEIVTQSEMFFYGNNPGSDPLASGYFSMAIVVIGKK